MTKYVPPLKVFNVLTTGGKIQYNVKCARIQHHQGKIFPTQLFMIGISFFILSDDDDCESFWDVISSSTIRFSIVHQKSLSYSPLLLLMLELELSCLLALLDIRYECDVSVYGIDCVSSSSHHRQCCCCLAASAVSHTVMLSCAIMATQKHYVSAGKNEINSKVFSSGDIIHSLKCYQAYYPHN